MTPKPFLIALLTGATLFLTTCKKDESANKDPQEPEEAFVMPTGEASKVLGKWEINSITVNNHYSGADHIATLTQSADDYVDFQTDGKMHTFVMGMLDVSSYRVHGTKEITIDGDPATVKVLADTRLVFISRDQTGTLGYTEVIYDLKK